jgi:hypothetical protein
MRDFIRLREHLALALLSAPLAFGCGPSTPKTHEPIGNETTVRDPPTAKYADWPTSGGGCGGGGTWCGPEQQANEAAGTALADSCPENFSHADLYFYMDTDATRAAADREMCCYSYSDGCMKGRPVIEEGQVRVASVRPGGAWTGRRAFAASELPAPLRAILAQSWLDDALLEHASVASFARATLELMAVGAPPDLIADCQRAALDEIRHAEGCFALVERYSGRRLAPGPMTPLSSRPATLERLAVDTFVEGCVAETVATLAATRMLSSCQDAEVADLLRRIIRDETRHASLAWRTLAWAVAEGGAPVAAAVRAAATPPTLTAGAADPTLLAHGRLDERTRIEATTDAWREIILPTLATLIA